MKKLCLLLILLIALSTLTITSCERAPVTENPTPDNFTLIGATTVAVPSDEPASATPESRHEPFEHEEQLYSRAVYVLDVYSGATVFEFNANERLKPASTLKIMTLIVALEMLAIHETDPDEPGLISVPWLIWERFETDDPNTVGGSMSRITGNQTTLTYRDLFFGLMLSSGNEASNIIAYNLGKLISDENSAGGFDYIETFVERMNAKARQLGMENSSFVNAHGLHEVERLILEGNDARNYTTVRDMAVLSRYGILNYPVFAEIVGTLEHQMPANSVYRNGYRLRNTNMLINDPEITENANDYFLDFVGGIKTGGLNKAYELENGEWIETGGVANLVSMGEFGGSRYIIATLEAPWNPQPSVGARLHFAYSDHHELYNWLLWAYS
jgi:D-alanyl-D-alanine carboxypeptidase